MIKRVILTTALTTALAAAMALVGGAALAAENGDAALKAAIAGSARLPANVARDGERHPYETLTFFGIKPNMTVVELRRAAAGTPRSWRPICASRAA